MMQPQYRWIHALMISFTIALASVPAQAVVYNNLVQTGLSYEEQTILRASNAAAGDLFGTAVALDGDTAVIGAIGENGPTNTAAYAGAVYVFNRDPQTNLWQQQTVLRSSNAQAGDLFGFSVAIANNTIVVGAPAEDGSANAHESSGAVYVFVRDTQTNSWQEQAILYASNAQSLDYFGWDVALAGDTIVVGAPGEDGITNSSENAGAAYVFQRAGSVWSEQAFLRASNANSHDEFGWSVDIANETIVVGAVGEVGADDTLSSAGAVYVFVHNVQINSWQEQAILRASNAETQDGFGQGLALFNDTVVIGAQYEDGLDNTMPDAGAAYIFIRISNSWQEQAILRASNAEAGDFFGKSLDLDHDTIIVASETEAGSNNTIEDAGAAYVFVPDGASWRQQEILRASNSDPYDYFGWNLALSSSTILIGATGESGLSNTTSSSGAAYIFTEQPNQPPTADAGVDQFVFTLAPVTLDGNASYDIDNDLPLTYSWSQTSGPPVMLSESTSSTLTFTAPDDPAILGFSLAITDTFGASSSDTVTITVINQAPTINIDVDRLVLINSEVILDAHTSYDADHDLPLTYTWEQASGPNIVFNNPLSMTTYFIAPSFVSTLTISLAVTDTLNANTTESIQLYVVEQINNVYFPTLYRICEFPIHCRP